MDVDKKWSSLVKDYWHGNNRLSELAEDIAEAMCMHADVGVDEKAVRKIYKLFGKSLPVLAEQLTENYSDPSVYAWCIKPLSKIHSSYQKRAAKA